MLQFSLCAKWRACACASLQFFRTSIEGIEMFVSVADCRALAVDEDAPPSPVNVPGRGRGRCLCDDM